MEKDSWSASFLAAVPFGDYVYFTPYNNESIIRLNIHTERIERFCNWALPLQNLSGCKEEPYFRYPIVSNETIWIATSCANAIVEFNMITNSSNIHIVGGPEYRYGGIVSDGPDFWLSPHTGTTTPLIKWNPQKGILKEISEIYDSDSDKAQCGFAEPLCVNGFLYLFPKLSSHAYKVKLDAEQLLIADELESAVPHEYTGAKYYRPFLLGGSVYIFNLYNDTLNMYSFSNGESKEMPLNYSAATQKEICQLLSSAYLARMDMLKTPVTYEDSNLGLADLLRFVQNSGSSAQTKLMELTSNSNNCNVGTADKKIYEYVKMLTYKEGKANDNGVDFRRGHRTKNEHADKTKTVLGASR